MVLIGAGVTEVFEAIFGRERDEMFCTQIPCCQQVEHNRLIPSPDSRSEANVLHQAGH